MVDCKFKPTLIPQLKNLEIIKQQTGIGVVDFMMYPIYTIDSSKVGKIQYCMQELVAA